MHTLSSLIDIYNKSEIAEFEIRVQELSRTQFESVAKRLAAETSDITLTCTINFVTNHTFMKPVRGSQRPREHKSRRIIEMYFKDGVKTDTKYVEKTTLAAFKHAGLIISVASERDVSMVSPNDAMHVRFKARLSFKIGDWRYDLTAVRTALFADIKNSLVMVRDRMFIKGLSPANFFDKFAFGEATSYDLEVEYVGTKLDENKAQDCIDGLPSIVDPGLLERIKYQGVIYELASYIVPEKKEFFKRAGLKSLGNPVLALTKTGYYTDIFPPIGYFITEKADGVRCFIYIKGAECTVLTSAGIIYTSVKEGGDEFDSSVTIAEGELVGGKDIYLFDCLVDRDDDLVDRDFSARLAAMADVALLIESYVSPALTIATKTFTKITSSEDIKGPIEAVYGAEYDYEIDGIILIEDGKPYSRTRNYKWKPSEMNTIDFLAVKAHPTLLGTAPYIERAGHNIYILMNGISSDMYAKLGIKKIQGYEDMLKSAGVTPGDRYFPLQFVSSSNPLAYIYQHPIGSNAKESINGKIIELRWIAPTKGGNGDWEMLRVRNDRSAEQNYYGNNYNVAEITFSNYIDPFPVEALWTKSSSYFTKSSSTMYLAPNKYKRYVIDRVLAASFGGLKLVIDIAAGRGADLFRYQKIGVSSALFMDIDSTAIAELIRRRFEGIRDGAKGGPPHKHSRVAPMTVMTMVADLKTPALELEKTILSSFSIPPGSVGGMVCNFAFHYMCDTLDHMRNLLMFVHDMLMPGGIFMFTTMNGSKVFDLLEKEGPEWFVKEGEVKKFAINKKYKGKTISAAGQDISVLLPLSDEMKDEPLANISAIITEAERIGFQVEINTSFAQDFDDFARTNASLNAQMTDDDRFYIDLHQVVTLRKKAAKK